MNRYAAFQTGPILCKDNMDNNVVDMDSPNVVDGQIDAMDTSDKWKCDSGIMNSTVVTKNINDGVGKSEKQ